MNEVKYLNNPERGPLFPKPSPLIMTGVTYLGPYVDVLGGYDGPFSYYELWVGTLANGKAGLMAKFGSEASNHSVGDEDTARVYAGPEWNPRPPLGEAYSRAVQFEHIKED